jgi:hypothetical protein
LAELLVEFILAKRGAHAWTGFDYESILGNLDYHCREGTLYAFFTKGTLTGVATFSVENNTIDVCNVVGSMIKPLACLLIQRYPGHAVTYRHKGRDFYYSPAEIQTLARKIYGQTSN